MSMFPLNNSILLRCIGTRGNLVTERRLLWVELGLHKQVVRGYPWILLRDFNVALNPEDNYFGSSLLTTCMMEFKDYVADIEVMDINCSGLHFTWNQKPKGGGDLPMNKPKPCKFFNFITHKSKFLDVVTAYWNVIMHGHNMFQLTYKLKALKKPLRKLVHDHGNLHDRVNKLRHELDVVQKALDLCPTDQNLREEEAIYVQAFNEAKLDEERFLQQKAKIEWLDVGDSNSTYFHKSLEIRNQRSRIEVILNANKVELSGPSVPDAFVNHYEMFLGTDMTCDDLNCDGLFHKVVSDQSCSNMIRNVTDLEIKSAMFSIGDDKAPCQDGYTSASFKKGWDIVGQDVCKADVVSDNQSAFVPGRRISDNILLIEELMHSYHRDRGPPRCAFKIDIQKAYDTVDWSFLAVILKRFGFHPLMTKWIMECVSSTSFSISVNGDVHGFFKGKRGLRQGDEDDLFIFARGDVNYARVIMESLDEFKSVSDLVLSLPKSTMFFCNVVNHVNLLFLIFRLSLKLCKSVISSMHVYWASVLMIPIGILLDIEQLIRGFLWCNGELKRGKAKVAWNDVCLPKCEGGLGIRSL
ncbi:aspartic peptidase [Tanacetum coccineum]